MRHINFMKFNLIAFIFTGIFVVGSVVSLCTKGLNYGIDFAGGISMEIEVKDDSLTLEKLRQKLSIYNSEIQSVQDSDLIMVRVGLTKGMTEEMQNKIVKDIKTDLGEQVEYRQIQVVGPKIGSELIRGGILAITFALLAMGVYIWIRYSGGYAIGACASMLFDAVALFGFFSFMQLEFSLTSVAVILLGMGYSMNDTIVNYDRIRENVHKFKKMPMPELIDLSINEMLPRTILTSVSTILVVLSLLFFGGSALHVFSVAMLFSCIEGVFSSIWVSNAILLKFNIRKEENN